MRAGLRVLGVAIKREPKMFAISTLGAVIFGALTVADAWVLGWSTDNVILPAFEDGVAPVGGLITAAALFIGVAIVRGVSIVMRRWGAGIMQYRMQAHDRRAVTRKYLDLPLEWHHRHPTGQLLSNANSDVEAAWAPIAPLPMAVGTIAMMVIAVGQMLLTDVVLAMVGLLVFPLVIISNLIFQRFQSPLMTRVQALRAELSEVAHESFDGALVVKSLGRETEETERFARKAETLRDTSIKAGYRPRRLRPRPRVAAQPRRARRAPRRRRSRRGRHQRARRRRQHLLPPHGRRLPDPLHRLAARRVPPLGRRLQPRPVGARRGRPHGVRPRPAHRPAAAAPVCASRTSSSRTSRATRSSTA